MHRFRFTLLASLCIAAPAAAQVSMIDAIGIAEGVVADRTLVQIRLEDEDPPVWKASFVNADLLDEAEVEIDAATGDVVDQGFEAIEPSDLAVYQAIFANPVAIAISFAEAVAAAEEAAGAKEAAFDAQLDFEAGILAYQVEFLPSEAKFYVDAATGAVANQHGDDEGDDDVIAPASLVAGIDAAVALNALPGLGREGRGRSGRRRQRRDRRRGAAVECQDRRTRRDHRRCGERARCSRTSPSCRRATSSSRLQAVINALGSINVTFAEAIDAATRRASRRRSASMRSRSRPRTRASSSRSNW